MLLVATVSLHFFPYAKISNIAACIEKWASIIASTCRGEGRRLRYTCLFLPMLYITCGGDAHNVYKDDSIFSLVAPEIARELHECKLKDVGEPTQCDSLEHNFHVYQCFDIVGHFASHVTTHNHSLLRLFRPSRD